MDFIGLVFRKLLAGVPCDSETEGAGMIIGVHTKSHSHSASPDRKKPSSAAKLPV
jgi:hypothetical protein